MRLLLFDSEPSHAAGLEVHGHTVQVAVDVAGLLALGPNVDACVVTAGHTTSALSELREKWPDVPVILLDDEDGDELALRSGCDARIDTTFDGLNETLSECRTKRAALLKPPTRKQVVAVDDDVGGILAVVSMALLRGGFQVHAATNGYAALRLLRAHGARVLLTDLAMPVMNGAELINAVQRYDASVVPILISGRALPEVEQARDACGRIEVLLKPVGARAIMEAVQRRWDELQTLGRGKSK